VLETQGLCAGITNNFRFYEFKSNSGPLANVTIKTRPGLNQTGNSATIFSSLLSQSAALNQSLLY
jgi:hypothetical protein